MATVIRKVAGGKLFRLDRKGTFVVLTGDFFLHPEETILDFNELLTRAFITGENLTNLWRNFETKKEFELIGVEVSDFEEALEALKHEN